MRNFRNWDVYRNARNLTVVIYQITKYFPDAERFGLISQIRRAAVSIVANIAEGAGRSTEKDFKHFLTIALGSAFEVEALIEVASDLKFLEEESKIKTLVKLEVIQKQLNAFITKLSVT
jgi:four helix bundle protein